MFRSHSFRHGYNKLSLYRALSEGRKVGTNNDENTHRSTYVFPKKSNTRNSGRVQTMISLQRDIRNFLKTQQTSFKGEIQLRYAVISALADPFRYLF